MIDIKQLRSTGVTICKINNSLKNIDTDMNKIAIIRSLNILTHINAYICMYLQGSAYLQWARLCLAIILFIVASKTIISGKFLL